MEVAPPTWQEICLRDQYWTRQERHTMPCNQYRHEDKCVIRHKIFIAKRFRHISWHSCHLGSSDVLPDTTHQGWFLSKGWGSPSYPNFFLELVGIYLHLATQNNKYWVTPNKFGLPKIRLILKIFHFSSRV